MILRAHVIVVLLMSATLAAAQPAGSRAQPPAQPEQAVPVASDQDARETRERFRELLERYPPALGRVFKLDPSLMQNQAYLAAYPGLAGFLSQHPEVAHNPAFFLSHINVPGDLWPQPTPSSEAVNLMKNTIEGFGVLLIFFGVTFTLGWLIKTLIDYRRWQRLLKIQTEVHNKLLDRFGGTEELLAYVQTPAARRFLESAPIPLEAPVSRSIAAPFGRILWSVQAGIVLAVAGIGLQVVSGRLTDPDVNQAVSALGVLVLSLGIAFVLAAGAAYLISRRLGLFEPTVEARQTPMS
jgi:hypothetical protein